MAALAPLAWEIGKDVAIGLAGAGIKKAAKWFGMKNGGQVPYNLKPHVLKRGARISRKRNMTTYQKNNDSVRAILQPGELVIPVKYYQKEKKRKIPLAAQVESMLKKRGIRLPNT
jgi:hypothetical protein